MNYEFRGVAAIKYVADGVNCYLLSFGIPFVVSELETDLDDFNIVWEDVLPEVRETIKKSQPDTHAIPDTDLITILSITVWRRENLSDEWVPVFKL